MASQSYYNPINGQPYDYNMQAQGYAAPTYQVLQQPARIPYMIQVDGEMAARAWQMPANLVPGTVIPIWDVDGIHVYFKSVDGYGRLNPTRKARIVFEDETQPLPEGASSSAAAVPGNYVTKSDFDSFRNEIKQMMSGNRQNGSYGQSYRQNGGQGQQKGGNENA